MTGEVRLAEPRDAAFLAEIDREALSASWTEESFRAELEKTWAQVWVYATEQNVLAFVHLWLVADEVQIINVATRGAHRRQGIARKLLERVLAECKARAFVSANLEVRYGNSAAISLYRSLGFAEDSVRSRYYTDGEDAVLMSVRWNIPLP